MVILNKRCKHDDRLRRICPPAPHLTHTRANLLGALLPPFTNTVAQNCSQQQHVCVELCRSKRVIGNWLKNPPPSPPLTSAAPSSPVVAGSSCALCVRGVFTTVAAAYPSPPPSLSPPPPAYIDSKNEPGALTWVLCAAPLSRRSCESCRTVDILSSTIGGALDRYTTYNGCGGGGVEEGAQQSHWHTRSEREREN